MNRKVGFWIAVWLVLVIVTGLLAFGHGWSRMGYGSAYGWGRMGGWDDSYRDRAAPGWYGMGPGMMGGAGAGYGWGPGRAHGMMGLYGPYDAGLGAGMGVAGGAYAMLPWLLTDLTPEQVQQIGALLSAPEGGSRDLLQQRWTAQASLARLYAADQRDWAAIRAASAAVADLQRRQMEAAIELQQRIDALLTDSQRRALARAQRSPGWLAAP